MSESNLYLVWSVSECGKDSGCKKGLFCSFADNDREYFLNKKESDKIYQRLYQNSSMDDDRDLKLYYRTFSPNNVVYNSILESSDKEYIEKFPNEIFCLWKISNISLNPSVINLYEFEDLALTELYKHESHIDSNDYLYGIDRIVIDNETMTLKTYLNI